ncbi:hypothetical protein SARC_11905 [Sphaeroforma arctica JP610]|uniref:Uncharacterized protein n=1 Tax=Sphaeroforma arctica JP610 TaxID=667725 RepID=A0A0L0FFN8_9EUKA|nr:hypothetical protein SARC_11905 [Sphaeroforma arctica JP610]KNC75574.1 hypothetical protein SARC_11905 [Sphaeroforma arctica JP610]|eukprot:XP_014149476.1 hypothetical protein SARC_11905 [Sphaeroforma arctica JP610]
MRAFSVDSGSLVSGSEVSMNDAAHTALSRNTSKNTIGDTSQMSFMGFLQTYASTGIPEPSEDTDTDAGTVTPPVQLASV